MKAFVVGVVLGAAAGGCGFEEFPIDEEPGDGPVCYSDLDCVPDDCCGEGLRAVHISEAPDCRGIQCAPGCDPDLIDCGCAYPVCRNSRCVAARSFENGCE